MRSSRASRSRQVVATRLEARGKHPTFLRMLEQYLEAMGIDSARTVLDMGCGTGVAARTLARRPSFKGRVVGVDRSPYLIAVADRLAREEGLSARIEFRIGDTHSLALAEASFDAVIAHTLISHVEDPAAVLAEMRRVVRPGGNCSIILWSLWPESVRSGAAFSRAAYGGSGRLFLGVRVWT